MRTFKKSKKLDNVCYDIRGPVVEEADRMTAEGIDIIMLNTGNPPTFNLNAPDEVIRDIRYNPVSYTHLDVYKRQACCGSCTASIGGGNPEKSGPQRL